MRYFTSDQHFFDTDIMSFTDRPYSSPEEMNDDIAERFLRKTADADEIYILGDIFGSRPPADQFGETRRIMERLGIDRRPFFLMRGNHDHLSDEEYLEIGFRRVMSHFAYITPRGRRVMITHDPCMIQPRGTLALCGHVHTLFRENWCEARGTFAVNVSVEVRDYAPLSEDEFFEIVDGSPYARAEGG